MSYVYVPEKQHQCPLPDRNSSIIDSIWRCDDCGTYYQFGFTEDSWGPVWHRVRWWHFTARRRIKERS